ncbi:MAG: chemotaxis protein CheA [Magnetococcales bacterium]|nr:chemotaxis protein CheA [Magnetococcales bacterium]NGZ26108.1 chemotaxis protein CheA [Magnetococcales bacterium]
MNDLMDESMRRELLGEFLSENVEILRRLESSMLLFESSPNEMDLIHAIFRDMHTLKGGCRMLGFERLEEVLHGAESLLGEYREEKKVLNPQGAKVLFRLLDQVGNVLPEVAAKDSEEGLDFSALLAEFSQLLAEDGQEQEIPDQKEMEGSGEEEVKRSITSGLEERVIRLTLDRLDFLIDLIGQLSAESNQLRYELTRNKDKAFQVMEAMEGRIHTLQDEVLQYRLQPVGGLWNSYQRLVRDLAMETGKRIFLEIEGEQTRVDRSVLLALKEVFVHLIRNAVDHGLEGVEERVARGKSPVGRIRLMADQRHGQVYIQVVDDGRGMDVERIKEKAVAMSLISPPQALEMSDSDARDLIFSPGFTTADHVGRISGRGAGMDAVRVAVEKVRGVIEVESEPGQGTTIRLRIPQTMAIVPALMVLCEEAWYGIPEAQVVELLSFYGEEIGTAIEGKLGQPMVRVRGQLVPLMPLEDIFHATPANLSLLMARDCVHVVILQGEGGQFGLQVESIGEIAHLVVKPLTGVLATTGLFSGAVVMADGRVSMLLDVVEVGRAVLRG